MALPSKQISSIIGAGGGDYTTLAAWEADLDDGVFGQDYIAEITGTTADTGTIIFSGCNSTVSYQAIIRAAAGQETDGLLTNKAKVTQDISYSNTSLVIFNLVIRDIVLEGGITFSNTFNNSFMELYKCLFKTNTSNPYAIRTDSANGANYLLIGGCLFRDCTGATAHIFQLSANTDVYVYNCTFDEGNYGGPLEWLSGVFNAIVNCVSTDCVAVDYGMNSFNVIYSCASDASINWATNKINKPAINQYRDKSNDDYRVKNSSADIYQAGTPISDSWFTTNCPTDLLGNAWHNPPSMGAYEFSEIVDVGLGEVDLDGLQTQVLQTQEVNVTVKNVSVESKDTFVDPQQDVDVSIGSLDLAGLNTSILQTQEIDIGLKNIILTSLDVEVDQIGSIAVELGEIDLNAINPKVLQEQIVNVTKKNVNIAPISPVIAYGVMVGLGSLEVNSINPAIIQEQNVNVTLQNVDVSSFNTVVELPVDINCTLKTISLEAKNTQLIQNQDINIDLKNINIDEVDSYITNAININVTKGNITLEGLNITVFHTPLDRVYIIPRENRTYDILPSSRQITEEGGE